MGGHKGDMREIAGHIEGDTEGHKRGIERDIAADIGGYRTWGNMGDIDGDIGDIRITEHRGHMGT